MGRKEKLEKALFALDSLDEAIRKQAIEELVRYHDPRALPALERISAQDPSLELRFLAKESIRKLKMNLTQETSLDVIVPGRAKASGEAAPPRGSSSSFSAEKLASYLANPDASLRNKAIKASVTYRNPQALDVLVPHLEKETDGRAKRNLLVAIGILGDKEQCAVLAKALDDEDPALRLHAVIGLSHIQHKSAYLLLVRGINDGAKPVRDAAFRVLIKLGRGKFLKLLEKMLLSSREWMREEAARACGKVNHPEVAVLLGRTFEGSQSPDLRRRLAKSLKSLARKGNVQALAFLKQARDARESSGEAGEAEDDARESVPSGPISSIQDGLPESSPGNLLQEDDPATRLAILEEIVNEQDEGRLGELIQALPGESDERVMASILIAVGKLGTAGQVGVIAPYLDHRDNRVRASAVEALSFIRDPSVVPLLQPMLSDRDNRTRANAIVALKDVPEVDLFKPLRQMVRSKNANAKLSAIYAILELGRPEFLPLLEKLVDDEDPSIERKAKQALSILREYEIVPGGDGEEEVGKEEEEREEETGEEEKEGEEDGGADGDTSAALEGKSTVSAPPPRIIHKRQPTKVSFLEKVAAMFGGKSAEAKKKEDDGKQTDVNPMNVIIITSTTVLIVMVLHGILSMLR